MHAKERNVRSAAWAPVVGFAGAVEGIVIAFARQRFLRVLEFSTQ